MAAQQHEPHELQHFEKPQSRHGTEHLSSSSGGLYKRASRRGAPRRFRCEYQGCDKVYSRHEHLQRHQLNHNPKEIFRCDEPDCQVSFVRADLLQRHKKRHSDSYVPRNRQPSFNPPSDRVGANSSAVLSPPGRIDPAPAYPHHSPSVPHDAAILLTPESSTTQTSASIPNVPTSRVPQAAGGWPATVPDMASCNIVRPKPTYLPRDEAPSFPNQPGVMAFPNMPFQSEEALSRENFAVWLFDSQGSYGDFSVASLPFLEGGLESPFNSNIHYDYESLTNRSQLDTPPRLIDGDDLLSEEQRQVILQWFQAFRMRRPKAEPLLSNLVHDSTGDIPSLNLEMMRDCLHEYWEQVSPRVPIVHQPTFACNRCPIFLLMVMVALGAASIRSRDMRGNLADYGSFADVIITWIRWEILTAEEASPPVALWVAQALLLLEFYEKMYSSRRLHERAHIYHSATLTLLRRGSPLIGRSGSESPPEEGLGVGGDHPQGAASDSRTWWIRWAETEAMHRVVFVAFMLDIIHAAMFGHEAQMAPHEIRLPLPCDDNLWTASSPDVVRHLDSNLRMYGVKPISFLDGLKRALHGKEVKTHSFGRMIIMSGLLSVGWHLSHRETHLKWLDLTAPSAETQGAWRYTLLRAFDDWKDSFDSAQGTFDSLSESPTQRGGSANGPIQSAALLYHLAHISLHIDIVDLQVYAGAKRLLGRKVSTRDYGNVISRMKAWAHLPSTRHAILHAFRLLHRVLVDPRRIGDRNKQPGLPAQGGISLPPIERQTYSCRSEPDPHRPWAMYYAALSIWSYVRALGGVSGTHGVHLGVFEPVTNHRRIVSYLTKVANLRELDESTDLSVLSDGLPDLLDGLQHILGEAHSELLQEAHVRLKTCREILAGGHG
ncbi:Zinc c2h2 type domain-containing protein [Pleurostoma richardsiae]|uniref:Zinc c2h2 type domain-containing protein n=1 Tax=Pleurostoma richardsiae TaxID=41990 RepID=A0AA38RJ62_9PEZI|nr:Zinc c2h2 type domain-containing protein [Pleurostoma richardsiae]